MTYWGFTLMRALVVASNLWVAPRLSLAGCCLLVKVESEPSAVHVRVCASDAGSECPQLLFDGEVVHGSPVSICSEGPEVTYHEFDAVSGEFRPATRAACGEQRNIEL